MKRMEEGEEGNRRRVILGEKEQLEEKKIWRMKTRREEDDWRRRRRGRVKRWRRRKRRRRITTGGGESLEEKDKMALRCSGVTRKGTQCSITSGSRLTDERGRLVAEPLQLGGAYCRFHTRHFVTQRVEHFDGPAVVFFLGLETTGVDVASDQII